MVNTERIVKIGKNIAYYRKKKGMTQKVLAEKIYITREQLSRIESTKGNTSTTIYTLFAIADALEIDIRLLFSFE